jgi:hypothetical protein
MNVSGGREVAGEEGEFGGEMMGFDELVFLTGMEEAEGGMILGAKHAAEAPVGEGELAEIGGGGFGALHGRLYVCMFLKREEFYHREHRGSEEKRRGSTEVKR